MNRATVPQRSPMGGSGDWGMPSSGASPVGSAGHPSIMRQGMDYNNGKGMMAGALANRSNSLPGARSMLQQQLMDMGMLDTQFLYITMCVLSIFQYHQMYVYLKLLCLCRWIWGHGYGYEPLRPAGSTKSVSFLARFYDRHGEQQVFASVINVNKHK